MSRERDEECYNTNFLLGSQMKEKQQECSPCDPTCPGECGQNPSAQRQTFQTMGEGKQGLLPDDQDMISGQDVPWDQKD